MSHRSHTSERVSARRADPGHERRFSLSVLGFPIQSEAEAAERLGACFGLEPERAVRYVREVPARVADDLTEDQLDVHVLILHDLGAELRVMEQGGAGRWTVPAPRELGVPSDREQLCRWRHEEAPVLRNRPADTGPEGSLSPDTGELAAVSGASPSVPEAAPAKRAPSIGVDVFAPPDLDGERPFWVDRVQTSEFFVRGLEKRQKRPSQPAGRKSRKNRFFKPEATAERRFELRQRIAKGALTFSVVLGGFMLLSALMPAGPEEISHQSDVGLFTAQMPPGFEALESREGVWRSPLGEMAYQAHSARKRGDALGALVFNLLDVPDAIRRRYSDHQVTQGALRAAVESQGGRLIDSSRVEVAGHAGLIGEYRVVRFGNTFVGRVQVVDVEGDVALLLCEGVGPACETDPRAAKFFESLRVEPISDDD